MLAETASSVKCHEKLLHEYTVGRLPGKQIYKQNSFDTLGQ